MSSLNKETMDGIKKISIPVDFHISGVTNENAVSFFGGDYHYDGDMGTFSTVGVDTINTIRVACPAFSKKSILLSLQIVFDESETNKLFRIGVGDSLVTDINEIKRQTKILLGGDDDKFVVGDTITQFWNIPLHLLINPDRFFFLTVQFDTAPLSGFNFPQFNIKGMSEVSTNYEYKNIK